MQLILDVMLEQQQQQAEEEAEVKHVNSKTRRSSYSSQETSSTAPISPYSDNEDDDGVEADDLNHELHKLILSDCFNCCDDLEDEEEENGDSFENEGSISYDELYDGESQSSFADAEADDELNDSYLAIPTVTYTGRSAILHVILEETELDLLMEQEDGDICAFAKAGGFAFDEEEDYLLESLVSFSESWICNDKSNLSFSDSLEGSFLIQ